MKSKYIIGLFSILIIILLIYTTIGKYLIFGFGYNTFFYGNEAKGNRIMKYALNEIQSNKEDYYYQYSIQNTKLGCFDEGLWALENSYKIDSLDIMEYYSWVLLYYYHDFEKSLFLLNKYDELTPNFSDAPMGEDIHYLKGLAFMNLNKHQEAINEFNININETIAKSDSSWVNIYSHINKGNCLSSLSKYEKAINEYRKAIAIYNDCAEAYYYMALANQRLGSKQAACDNFYTAETLLIKGLKSSDKYIELFHEIYLSQVQDSINYYCK